MLVRPCSSRPACCAPDANNEHSCCIQSAPGVAPEAQCCASQTAARTSQQLSSTCIDREATSAAHAPHCFSSARSRTCPSGHPMCRFTTAGVGERRTEQLLNARCPARPLSPPTMLRTETRAQRTQHRTATGPQSTLTLEPLRNEGRRDGHHIKHQAAVLRDHQPLQRSMHSMARSAGKASPIPKQAGSRQGTAAAGLCKAGTHLLTASPVAANCLLAACTACIMRPEGCPACSACTAGAQ